MRDLSTYVHFSVCRATCWESSNVGRTEGLTPDKWDIVKVYGDFRKFYWNGKKDAETQPGDCESLFVLLTDGQG